MGVGLAVLRRERTATRKFDFITQICGDPVAELTNAILAPLGDHEGWLNGLRPWVIRFTWLAVGPHGEQVHRSEAVAGEQDLRSDGDQAGSMSADRSCVRRRRCTPSVVIV